MAAIDAAPDWVHELREAVVAWTLSLMDERRPGLFRACTDAAMPFDFPSSKGCLGFLQTFKTDALSGAEDALRETVGFVQDCQDPDTGLFIDPHLDRRFGRQDDARAYRDFRLAVSKYAASLLRRLGAQPRRAFQYNTGAPGAPDPEGYLAYIKSGDWDAPWGTGSQAASRTVELFRLIGEGHEEYIPHVCEGIEFILSHQNAETGMWGSSAIPLHEQISGTLKVVGRFHRAMGLDIPYMDRLADSCIRHHADRGFYRSLDDMCIPLNAAIMCLTCLQESDYRREELRATLAGIADYLRSLRMPDGAFAGNTRGTDPIGWCGAWVAGPSEAPRSNVNGTQGALGCLGLIGAHLGWPEVGWGGRQPDRREQAANRPYRVMRAQDGRIDIVRA